MAGGGNWNVAENWDPVGIPNAVDQAVEFTLTGTQTINLQGGTYRIGSLTSGGSSNTTTISNGTLNLQTSADEPLFHITKSTTISADLTGTQGFRKTGSGTLYLSGTNSVTGDVYIDAGTLRLVPSSAGTSHIYNSATLSVQNSGTYANAITSTGGTISFNNQNINATFSGAIAATSGTTVIDNLGGTGTITWTGSLSGSSSISFSTGNGVHILEWDASSFTGTFTASGELTFLIGKDNAFGSGNTLRSAGRPILSDSAEDRTLDSV